MISIPINRTNEVISNVHTLSKEQFCALIEQSLTNVFDLTSIIKILVQKNRLDYIKIMYGTYLNLFEGSTTALNQAILYQRIDIIQYLLDIGTDPNCTSLYYVIEQNNVNLLNLLLKHGLNKKLFVIQHAYSYCTDFNYDIIKIMVELEDVNVIAKAVSDRWYLGNRTKIVMLLLDYGADIKLFKAFMSKPEYAEYIAKQIWILKKVLKNADQVMLDESRIIHAMIKFIAPKEFDVS